MNLMANSSSSSVSSSPFSGHAQAASAVPPSPRGGGGGGVGGNGVVSAAASASSSSSSGAVNRRMRPEDSALHITVSDPVQHSDGLNKYTSYRVDVRPPIIPGSGGNNDGGGGIMSDVSLGNNHNHPHHMNTNHPYHHHRNNHSIGPTSVVLRRYSDFLWLFERLHVERAGAIVPPLPEKQPVGRFHAAFVEERRSQLELFLRRVAVHPELCDAASMSLFLHTVDEALWTATKNNHNHNSSSSQSHNHNHATAAGQFTYANHYNNYNSTMSIMDGHHSSSITSNPTAAAAAASTLPKKDGIKRWFAETKTSMTGDLVRSVDDELFEEIHRYVSTLDTQMKNVITHVSGLVRKGKELANGMFEFGLAFHLLGQSEADALGTALTEVGGTADQLSVLSAELAEQEMRDLEEPLHDYIKLIYAVKLALQRRHEKRLTYSTCLHDVESKNAQLAKLRMQGVGPSSSGAVEAKIYTTEMAVRRAHEAADVAREDFAVVSQRVLREVDRFKREKQEEMRRVVLDYIHLQVQYNKRMEETWAALIPKLEAAQSATTPSHGQYVQPQQLQYAHAAVVPVVPPQQLHQAHAHPAVLPPAPVSPEASPPVYSNAPTPTGSSSASNASLSGPPIMPHHLQQQQPPYYNTVASPLSSSSSSLLPQPPQQQPPLPPPSHTSQYGSSSYSSSSSTTMMMYGNNNYNNNMSHVHVPPSDPSSMLNVQYRDTSTLPP